MPVPATHAHDLVRSRLAAQFRREAGLPAKPEDEHTIRMRLLGALLHPHAGVVQRAISQVERGGAEFPTVERERIADYISRAFERRLLGDGRLDLQELLSRSHSPFAWGDSFAKACAQSGVKEVARARSRTADADIADYDSVGILPVSEQHVSAEDAFLSMERNGRAEALASELASRGKLSGHEATHAKAKSLRLLLGVPAPEMTSREHRSWVARCLRRDDAMDVVRESLIAHRDLASGDPHPEQLSVDDRLMDLWMDYTAEHAETLLAANPKITRMILIDAATLPPQPAESRRTAMRRELRTLSNRRGWTRTVMRLETAWTAEFFDCRSENNNMDSRTWEEAEEARAAAAEDWPAAAVEALSFPGRPLVRESTPEDVAAYLHRVYDRVCQPVSIKSRSQARNAA